MKKYDNSAKAKMIRVAADEKDKKYASTAGKKRLDEDISSMINMSSTSMGCGVNMKSGCQVSKHMGGPKMSADLKYMPVDDKASSLSMYGKKKK